MENNNSQIVSLIWNIADDVLRDVFLRGQYRDVILPMVVLRRLDALLEPTKEEVEKELKEMDPEDEIDEDVMCNITQLSYYNTSKWTLNRLKDQAPDNNDILYKNFVEYLSGYSDNVKDVLDNFDYYNKARKLADNDRLLAIIERITDPRINLTNKPQDDPDGLPLPPLDNVGMGTVFEELLRRFNEMRRTTRRQVSTSPHVMLSRSWRTSCSSLSRTTFLRPLRYTTQPVVRAVCSPRVTNTW